MDVKRNGKPKRWAIHELLKGDLVRHDAMPAGDHLWMNKSGTIFKRTATGTMNKVNINGENHPGDLWRIFRPLPKFANGDRAIDATGHEVKIIELVDFHPGRLEFMFMVRDTSDGRTTFLASEKSLKKKGEKAI